MADQRQSQEAGGRGDGVHHQSTTEGRSCQDAIPMFVTGQHRIGVAGSAAGEHSNLERSMQAIPISVAPTINTTTTETVTQTLNMTVRPVKGETRKAKREQWEEESFVNLPKCPAEEIAATGEDIMANFFQIWPLSQGTVLELHKYRIELGKVKDNKTSDPEFRRKLINNLLESDPPTLSTEYWTTDFKSYIVSAKKLYNTWIDESNPRHVKHSLSDPTTSQESPITSRIIYDGFVDFNQLRLLIKQDPSINPAYRPTQDIEALNIVIWHKVNNNNFKGLRIGQKFFPDSISLSDELRRLGKLVYKAKTGFFTSVRPGINRLLLNVNCTTSVFFPPISLQDFLAARWGTREPKTVVPTYGREIRGLRVTSELLDPQRVWSVCSVRGQTVSEHIFRQDGKDISLFEYMTHKYPRVNFQPLACSVNLGSEINPFWHPADKLHILPDQLLRSQIPSQLAEEMLRVTKRTPEQNKQKIMDFARKELGFVSQMAPGMSYPALAYFGLSLEEQLLHIPSRFLVAPTLQFANNGKKELIAPAMDLKAVSTQLLATWDLIGRKFFSVPVKKLDFKVFRITCLDPKVDGPQQVLAIKFLKQLQTALLCYGFTKTSFKMAELNLPVQRDVMGRQTELFAKLDQAYDSLKGSSLVVVLLQTDSAVVYSDIKRWSDCKRGIPTVCVKPTAVSRSCDKGPGGDKNMLANICLKINLKLGGTGHTLKKAWYGAKSKTMIVGADVTHPDRTIDPTCPSMAGVVATCDSMNGHYLASARLQSSNTEVRFFPMDNICGSGFIPDIIQQFIEDLRGMIEERVQVYYEKNNTTPDHILLYRDGVSESQYGMVYKQELPQIEEGCRAVGLKVGKTSSWVPLITIVVCGKRHHTRFFPKDDVKKVGRNTLVNVKAGLVIDHSIVAPNKFDFYLQSHDSQAGTARSCHYVIITNGSNYTVSEIQEVTHNLCFSSARATKGMSICAPARYADILCDRLRCYLKPVLVGEMPRLVKSQPSVYHNNPTVWGPAPGRSNPWTSDHDNVMFYL